MTFDRFVDLLHRTLAGLALAAGAAGMAHAQAPAAPSVDELERVFWICDHATTRQALDMGTAQDCSIATERLRIVRFKGDFNAMLAWWREHKTARHQALDAAWQAAMQGEGTVRPVYARTR